MLQKYLISIDYESNILKIGEYAIIDKVPKKFDSLALTKDYYSLLGEETYDRDDILQLISKGNSSLIAALRTRNFFPIEACAQKIATTIKKLYQSSTKNTAELFFNDMEVLPDKE
ncbi:MAG: hypothetical protein LJE94_06635 [Deltaproteobacteria bacterium]|nr:hypothetical protein [Deltaproteobacteria bacterium]